MTTAKTAEYIFDKYACQYQDKYMNVETYSQGLDMFCNAIKRSNANVLELGCGPGNMTHYVLNKRPDLKIFATDISKNMILLAKNNVANIDFAVMDCREITQLNKKYDAILCGFCLPYLNKDEAKKLLQDSAQLLHQGGVMYIGTIQGEYSDSALQGLSSCKEDALQLYYYSTDQLMKMVMSSGFSLITEQRINRGEDNDLVFIINKTDVKE